MNPYTLMVAKQRQRELLREARAIRASERRRESGPSPLRHGVAQTLRRVADHLEPAA